MNEAQSILIPNPTENKSSFSSFFSEDSGWKDILKETLDSRHATPQSHPHALELFAGDGPIAGMLHEWGWQDITCADLYLPKKPLAPKGSTWIFLDLAEVIERLNHGGDLNEINFLKNEFDIVTATFPRNKHDAVSFDRDDLKELTNFFSRPDGVVFVAG